METHARTLAKAATWQLLGLLAMTLIGYAFTGSIGAGGALALASTACGTVTYVVHERAWARVRWGRHDGSIRAEAAGAHRGAAGGGRAG